MRQSVLIAWVLLLLCQPSFVWADTGGTDNRAQGALDYRLAEAKRALDEVMASPDQSIPEELLSKCKAIAIYPRVVKGAFIFGARFGRGVVLKRDEETGVWGPPAFSTIGGGSWGLQIGGQATDLILVIMNDKGLEGLLSNNFTLGVDASVAAGPVGRKSGASTDLSLRAGILSYSRSLGLFAGIGLDGALLTQDNHSNSVYYGRQVTSREILLEGAVEAQPSSETLINTLSEYASDWYLGERPIKIEQDLSRVPDYEGEVESIDFKKGEIAVLNTRPAEIRGAGEPDQDRFRTSDPELIGALKVGDQVKVYLKKGTGQSKEIYKVVKKYGYLS